MPKKRHWTSLPYDSALRYLETKRVITRPAFDRLAAEAQRRAFTVTGVHRLDILQKVLDAVTDAAAQGKTAAEFSRGLDRVFDRAGIGRIQPWRAETIFRTGLQSAYGRGRWERGTIGDLADTFWGWRYITVGDDRVRESHSDLDGSAFQKGDATNFFPPWDYNCRCSSEWITNEEAEAEGLDVSDQVSEELIQEVLTNDFTSPALGLPDREPDLSGYDSRIVADYLKERRARR